MKKSIVLMALSCFILFSSCNKDEVVEQNIKKIKDISPVARALGMFAGLEETEPADATFHLLGQSGFAKYTPQGAPNGQLSITPDYNLDNVNIGDIKFNDVEVTSASKYVKFYGISEINQEQFDIASLFGRQVTVSNANCTGSQLCNFNFNIPLIHKFKNVDIVGNIDQYYISKSIGFSLTWDNTTVASDELLGVYVSVFNPNAKVGDVIPAFAKLIDPRRNNVSISASELSVFSINDIITIDLIKGKSYTNPLQNGKKVRIIAADIMSMAFELK